MTFGKRLISGFLALVMTVQMIPAIPVYAREEESITAEEEITEAEIPQYILDLLGEDGRPDETDTDNSAEDTEDDNSRINENTRTDEPDVDSEEREEPESTPTPEGIISENEDKTQEGEEEKNQGENLPEDEIPADEYEISADDVTVEYGDIVCGQETQFTVVCPGAPEGTQYRFGSVSLYQKDEYSDAELVLVVDPSRGRNYVETNTFTFTFFVSGKYQLEFNVLMKNAEGEGYTSVRKLVNITIEDENYPSVEEVCDSIIDSMPEFTTDYEKVKWIHDYILGSCTYDTTLTYCSAEGALVRGRGTCEAYHRAFVMLLNRAGIENGRIVGNGHVWTAVKMDGKWYQIDTTWDDYGGYDSPYLNQYYLYFGLTDEITSFAHSDHTAKAGYESVSLEDNYFIKSGEIDLYTDIYREIIAEEISRGTESFTIDVREYMRKNAYQNYVQRADSFKNIIYNIAAYSLSNSTWNSETVESVCVTYSDNIFTVTIQYVSDERILAESVNISGYTITNTDESVRDITAATGNTANIYLTERQSLVLRDNVVLNPVNSEDLLVWETSDISVATVKNGVVKAVGIGTAVITVTTENGYSAKFTVKVLENKVKSIALGTESEAPRKEYETGEAFDIDNLVIYRTYSDGVTERVYVTGDAITGFSSKTARNGVTVTVTYCGLKKTFTVNIKPVRVSGINITGKYTAGDNVVVKGQSVQLTAEITPENAYSKNVLWTVWADSECTKKTSLATITSRGVLKGAGYGTVYVRAQSKQNSDVTAVIPVTVTQKQTVGIEVISGTKLQYTLGSSWKYSDVKIRFVNNDGTYTTTGITRSKITSDTSVFDETGYRTVRVTYNGGFYTDYKVEVVENAPSYIKLVKENNIFNGEREYTTANNVVGSERKLNVVFSPEGSLSDVIFTSSKPEVASVSRDGTVHFLKKGTVTITARTISGKKRTISLTVVDRSVSSVSADISGLGTVYAGDEIDYSAIKVIRTYNDGTTDTLSGDSPLVTISRISTAKRASVKATVKTAGKTCYAGITVNPVKRTGIEINDAVSSNGTLNSLVVGNYINLSCTFFPDNTTDKRVTYKVIGGDGRVTISGSKMTATRRGNVTILATSRDGRFTAVKTFTVYTKSIENIHISKSRYEYTVNRAFDWNSLKLSRENIDGTTYSMTYSKADYCVSGFDTSRPGIFTATLFNLKTGMSAEFEYCVSAKAVTSVSLSYKSATFIPGDTVKLTAKVSPLNATYADRLTWSSSDENIATVDENGNVTFTGAGSVKITVTANNVKTASVTLKCVSEKITSVSLLSMKKTYSKGENFDYSNLVLYCRLNNGKTKTVKNLTEHEVTLKGFSTEKVRTYNALTITYQGKSLKTYYDVVNPEYSESVYIYGNMPFYEGENISLILMNYDGEILTADGWSSSDESIAAVDANGKVQGISAGTALVKALYNGEETGVYVSVEKKHPLVSISISGTDNILTGNTAQYRLITNPANTTEEVVAVWESMDESVVTVDSNGVVTAVDPGETYIKVTVGELTATHKVRVYNYSGWLTVGKEKYYYDEHGKMQKSTALKIDGTWYNFDSQGRMFKVLDISQHNDVTSWQAMYDDGVRIVILRAGARGYGTDPGYGNIKRDRDFKEYLARAKAVGMKVGVYFFTTAISEREAIEEANVTLEMIGGRELDLPVYIDSEYSGAYTSDGRRDGRADYLSRADRTRIIKAFLTTIENAGYDAGIYASVAYFFNDPTGLDASQLTQYSFWVADWRSSANHSNTTDYDVWQYNCKGRVAGCNNDVDMNIVNRFY